MTTGMFILGLMFFLPTTTAQHSPFTAVYQNHEFGITMPVPAGVLLCSTPNNERDHGPIMLLHSSDAEGCKDSERARAIDIFASYNAADATRTLNGFLNWQCSHLVRSCLPAPGNLHVRGRASVAAMQRGPSEWIDVIVLTQGGAPDPKFDAAVPSINYTIRLHTKQATLEQDLQTLRLLLRTVKLAP